MTNPDSAVSPDTQLRGRRRTPARAAWFLILVVGIGLNFFGVPLQFARWGTVCSGAACVFGQLTPEQGQELHKLGLSLPSWAAFLTASWILPALVFLLVAAVIFWRRADDRMAFFASFMLLTSGLGSSLDLQSSLPVVRFLSLSFAALGNVCLGLFLLVFPDGRFVPGWTRWLVPLIVLKEAFTVLRPDYGIINGLALTLVEIPLAVLLQLYRYRRVSTPIQRQQTKWVVFGTAAALIGIGAVALFFTGIYPIATANVLVGLIGITSITLFLLFIPLSFGIAILRTHLWDIDILIRRTLIYGTLTAMLGGVYFSSIVVLQQFVHLVTRQDESGLVTVFSTLAIAALFTPLRGGIQGIIDRRFYRRKYDATRVLETFAATVRDNVELDKLTDHLLGVVEETMQPAYTSMWLRASQDEGRRAENEE